MADVHDHHTRSDDTDGALADPVPAERSSEVTSRRLRLLAQQAERRDREAATRDDRARRRDAAVVDTDLRRVVREAAADRAAAAHDRTCAARDRAILVGLVGEVRDRHSHPALTTREEEVLARLGSAMTNREIAADLFLSVNSVKTHLRTLYQKLGVSSRTAAALRARAVLDDEDQAEGTCPGSATDGRRR